jgi:chromosome partitioning protein
MIVAIINMKGGVGKTTLAVNISLGLARFYKKKTLLVDLDPQFNATQYLVKTSDYINYLKDPARLTIRDVFVKRASDSVGIADAATQTRTVAEPTIDNCTIRVYTNPEGGHLDLIPSTLDLMEADTFDRGSENKLKYFLDKIKPAYDFILIDSPPTISIFTMSAFLSADSYLVPVKPDYLSSIGLSLVDRAMRRFAENFGKQIDYLGLVFSMVQNTNLMKKTMETIRTHPEFKCFDGILSHSTKIAQTVEHNQNIFDIPASSGRYANEMTSIVDEFVKRVC